MNCELTRHSADVLKRDRIYIEGHRGISAGQKNHNTKEAILESINQGVESVEIDVWLTTDNKLVVIHDFQNFIYECEKILEIPAPGYKIDWHSWEDLKTCVTKEGKNKIPFLEEIMEITKGKIFLNLEIKGSKLEIWDYIQDLIEKYEYYDQISICAFNHKYYEKVEKYNKDFNRTIVFGHLTMDNPFIDTNIPNHQISINALLLKGYPKIVEDAHNNNMTVGVYFFNEPRVLYEIFEYGIDVVITDYPVRAAEQLKKYYSGANYLEGCKSIGNNFFNKSTCTECENGYELVYIYEKDRNICKLKYELHPDLYIKDDSGVYHEKNIFAIKMLFSPTKNGAICQKNGKKIFYFEWLFDLIGYDYDYYKFVNFSENYHPYQKNFILDKDKSKNSSTYSLLTKEHIKKLNFDELEIYVGENKIAQKDFLCKDLFSTSYYTTYTVMGTHCYFTYEGNEDISYATFKLFDKKYVSYVTYDDKYLSNSGSWGKETSIRFSKSDSICNSIEDPFELCTGKISNCMLCENENKCKKCNEEYSLVNGECFPSINYENNPKYFTPDYGISYFTCSSVIDYCEECYYDIFSVNNFHCTKCSDGINLEESHICDINQHVIPFTNTLSGKIIGSSCYNENNILNCNLHKIGLPNFSCWKFKDNSNNQEHCIIYPDDESTQKEYYKLYLGTAKEDLITKSKNEDEIMIPEKETYKKDETVIFTKLKDILTNEDKSIINKSNTCYSQFYKGYSNFLKNGVFTKIENPNLCFNADIFPDNSGILNCGFANISLSYGQKKYNIQTCFFMPDNKISKIMSDFVRRALIEEMWGKEGTFGKLLKNNNTIFDNNIRRLQENELSFEMIIENKKGKVIKYDSKSYNMTIVKDEKEDDDDNDNDNDDSDIEIIKPNNSNGAKFNWLIAIYIILSLF